MQGFDHFSGYYTGAEDYYSHVTSQLFEEGSLQDRHIVDTEAHRSSWNQLVENNEVTITEHNSKVTKYGHGNKENQRVHYFLCTGWTIYQLAI